MEKTLNFSINESQKTLIKEIQDVCRQMASTNTWFQMEDDVDLIDACIYQREVLNARYRYLIRKARNENISMALFSQKEC